MPLRAIDFHVHLPTPEVPVRAGGLDLPAEAVAVVLRDNAARILRLS